MAPPSVQAVQFPKSYELGKNADSKLKYYHEALEKHCSKKTEYHKWTEYRMLIVEAERHVARRLESRSWSRGAKDSGGLIDPSWKNNEPINLYNQLNGHGKDSSCPTPEAYAVAIRVKNQVIEMIDNEINLARSRNSKTCPGLKTSFTRRARLYSENGEKSPYQQQDKNQSEITLTTHEASLWKRQVTQERENLDRESKRKWGLCRDWAASIVAHLNNKFPDSFFKIWSKEFNKQFMGCPLQHTVVLITDEEGDIAANGFTFVIDAWKNPTVFRELENWKIQTRYG